MLDPEKVREVLEDPDIKKLFIDQLADAQFKGYLRGVLKGIDICEKFTGLDLSQVSMAAMSIDMEGFKNDATD